MKEPFIIAMKTNGLVILVRIISQPDEWRGRGRLDCIKHKGYRDGFSLYSMKRPSLNFLALSIRGTETDYDCRIARYACDSLASVDHVTGAIVEVVTGMGGIVMGMP